MYGLHRVAVAEALWHATHGDEAAALDLTAVMLRQLGRYLRTARGPMGAYVSVTVLRSTFALAGVLRIRIENGAEVPESVRGRYREALRSIDLDPVILEHIVIGDYLWAQDALARVNNGEDPEFLGDALWTPRLLYTQGHATARLDEAYAEVIAVARDPFAPIPEAPEPRLVDRILHPISTTLMLVLDPRILLVQQIVEMREELVSAEAARAELLGH